jgi:hypothetical protein
MAKYINRDERVYALGEKFLIPNGEAVELTATEEKHPVIAPMIEKGKLEKVAESATEPTVSIDDMTVPQLKEYAALNKIDLGDATKKEDILAAIKAAEAK